MIFFLDTEFIEDGKTIDLISIGIVDQDNKAYYAISNEFDPGKANQWVQENVLTRLEPRNEYPDLYKSKDQIRQDILNFVGASKDDRPKFWGYYCAYDWVVICQLFGSMIDLPEHWPMYCRDLKQACNWLGNPTLPDQYVEAEHNALSDALWNKEAFEFLESYQSGIPDCA